MLKRILQKTLNYMRKFWAIFSSIFLKIWVKYRSFRKIYQILIAVVLLALLIAGKIAIGFLGYKQYPKVVESHKVTKSNIMKTIRLFGALTAEKLFIPTAGYEGTVVEIANAGTYLKAGEIIARIQNTAIEDAYHAALKAAQIAGEQYNRQIELYNDKAASKKSVEDRFIAFSNAKAALVLARMNYDKIVFVAPFDGVVGSAVAHVGSRAKAGDEIVSFYDASAFRVNFDIPSDVAKQLSEKPLVTIQGQDYNIDFIQKALKTGTYAVPANIRFPCDKCVSGELMDVDLHVVSKKDIIVVPKSCIMVRNNGHFAYKIDNGKAELVDVELGVSEKDMVEIVDGLTVGDEIVSKGLERLYPGIDVLIYKG